MLLASNLTTLDETGSKLGIDAGRPTVLSDLRSHFPWRGGCRVRSKSEQFVRPKNEHVQVSESASPAAVAEGNDSIAVCLMR